MEYTKPSSKNPGLIVFVIDSSKSMQGSSAHRDIERSLEYLRSLGRKKPKTINFATIQFASSVKINHYTLENSSIDFTYSLGPQTNIPHAIGNLISVIDDHVNNVCECDNPLINILFFTDGKDTIMKHPDNVTSYLSDLFGKQNIMIGLIDYDEISPLEELPSRDLRYKDLLFRYRLARASYLTEEIVEKAYAVERKSPPVLGKSLKEIFGNSSNLIDKQLILSSKTVKRHPNVTTSFIKLGTFSVAIDLMEKTESNYDFGDAEYHDI